MGLRLEFQKLFSNTRTIFFLTVSQNNFDNKILFFPDDDGVIEVLEGYELPLVVYGHGFTKDSQVILSTSIGELGEDCKSDETHIKTNLYSLSNVSPDGTSAILMVSVTPVFEFERT